MLKTYSSFQPILDSVYLRDYYSWENDASNEHKLIFHRSESIVECGAVERSWSQTVLIRLRTMIYVNLLNTLWCSAVKFTSKHCCIHRGNWFSRKSYMYVPTETFSGNNVFTKYERAKQTRLFWCRQILC